MASLVREFTPITQTLDEYIGIAVRANRPIKSAVSAFMGSAKTGQLMERDYAAQKALLTELELSSRALRGLAALLGGYASVLYDLRPLRCLRPEESGELLAR